MKTNLAEVGARGVDSLEFSQSGTAAQATSLKASGIDFVVGYLGVVNPTRLGYVLSADLAFVPTTLAATVFDGDRSVSQCKALGLPAGMTVWLDLEGNTICKMSTPELIGKINGWASAIKTAGYEPGLYVGAPQPLTSEELYKLAVVRYWHSLSREADRFGKLAEPSCGWCMWQMNPSLKWRNTGLLVDVDIIGKDFLGRLPSWACA